MALYGTGSNPKIEWLINGVWTDLSSRVRQDSNITISRGKASEQGTVSPQSLNASLNNRDGVLTNRNPTGIYYRYLPRNTQVRCQAGTGESYVRTQQDHADNVADRAATPDTAALDVVGDLEVRADIWPYSWRARKTMPIMSKWLVGGNQRSWALFLLSDGRLSFVWSTDGTTQLSANSTVAIGATSGRLAVKATIDVVNGANKTVEFWTSTTGIDGTYTQLGTSVTTAGTTSIFSSSAAVVAGMGDDDPRIVAGGNAFRGRIYKLRMYNGIAGTIVANPDFTAQPIQTSSFGDSAARTWTVGGSARITSDRVRFWGELSAPPIQTDVSARDIYMPITASGILRRLTQGNNPVSSAIYRSLDNKTLSGYWPLEDGSSASTAASAVETGRPGVLLNMTMGTEKSLPGAVSAATFTNQQGKFVGTPLGTTTTNTNYFTFFFKLTSLPGSQVNFALVAMTGTARLLAISVGPVGFKFDFFGADGSTLSTASPAFGAVTPLNKWVGMNVLMTTSGGTVSWTAKWLDVTSQTIVGVGPNTYSGSAGRIAQVTISANSSPNYVGGSIGHVHTATSDLSFSSTTLTNAANAFLGETAGARLFRVATEEGIGMEVTGDYVATEQMGYQPIASVMTILQECADVDLGILGESRDSLALTYRTRADMSNRQDAVYSYALAHLAEELTMTEDDSGIFNDVTVNRSTIGSSARREITSGFMSVSAPPTGIGRYDTEVTVNHSSDGRLIALASWLARRGSVDKARVPNLTIDLHRSVIQASTSLVEKTIGLNLGDTTAIQSIISAVAPPDDVPLLVQGMRETLGKFLWTIKYNTTPADLYATGRYDYGTEYGTSRYDHASSTISVAATSGQTTLQVTANSTTPVKLDLWTTTSGSYPFDLMVMGERMTATAIAAGPSDNFNRVTASGWGSTSTGAIAWTTSGGSATDYATTGTRGTHNLSTVTVERVSSLGLTFRPAEVYIDRILFVANPTGGGGQAIGVVRVGVSGSTYIRTQFFVSTTGAITAALDQQVNGVQTVVDATFPTVAASGPTGISFRYQQTSTVARMRAWSQGTTEPAAWTCTINLTAQPTAGTLELASSRNSSTTNVPPYTVEWDDISFPQDQIFTVTRSVNTVVKSHAVNEAVRLFQPSYWRL